MLSRRLVNVLLLAGAILTAGCSSTRTAETVPASQAASGPTSIANALASAVDLRAIGCRAEAVRGAGAMIEGGYILTAAHVVAGALSISVVAPGSTTGEPTPAQVVALDPANDLALLTAAALNIPQLQLGTMTAGDVGTALIFRDAALVPQPFTVVRPVIVHILDIYDRDKVNRAGYQVEIEISSGDSGAVLIGPDGHAGATLYAKSRAANDRAWAVGTQSVPALIAIAKAGPIPAAPVGECAR